MLRTVSRSKPALCRSAADSPVCRAKSAKGTPPTCALAQTNTSESPSVALHRVQPLRMERAELRAPRPGIRPETDHQLPRIDLVVLLRVRRQGIPDGPSPRGACRPQWLTKTGTESVDPVPPHCQCGLPPVPPLSSLPIARWATFQPSGSTHDRPTERGRECGTIAIAPPSGAGSRRRG